MDELFRKTYKRLQDFYEKHYDRYHDKNRNKEYYLQILGLPINATKNDIKKQYIALILRHHPDKGGEPETFMKIHNAYKELQSAHDSDDSQKTK